MPFVSQQSSKAYSIADRHMILRTRTETNSMYVYTYSHIKGTACMYSVKGLRPI